MRPARRKSTPLRGTCDTTCNLASIGTGLRIAVRPHEVYQQFVMVDALAQFGTDKMDLEQTVKWAEEKIKAIQAKFV